MSTPQPIQPIRETVAGALRNALTIAMWQDQAPPGVMDSQARKAFDDIARLLRHALAELSEPSLAAMQAGEILLREWSGTPEPERQLRDTLAGILRAQVTGEIPKTWERE